MQYVEFYERTNTEISLEEYHYVEESYYDFEGDKDEFCKAWLKDFKSGKWAMEYKLRKALDDQKAEYESQLAEKDETIAFYRPFYTEVGELRKKLNAARVHLEAIVKDFRNI